jgi:citryl-CoA lyase
MGQNPLKNKKKYEDYWKTKISLVENNRILLRGYPLQEITGKLSYLDCVLLLLRGEIPTPMESKVIEAVMTAAMEHMLINSVALAGRVAVSANPDPVVGIASGILCFGTVTAGVPKYVCEFINKAYDRMKTEKLSMEAIAKIVVKECMDRNERVPGFGHPVHSLVNEHYNMRSNNLYERVRETGFNLNNKVKMYEAIHSEVIRVKKMHDFPINVDGLIGAILAEMDYDPLEIQALMPLTMIPGLIAHVVEEIREGSPLRIVPDTTYIGVKERHREVKNL